MLLTLPFASGKLLEESSRFFGVEPEEGSSSKGIYVIFHAGGWEICHETMIALPSII
jgi:hypothetical protein